MFPRRLTCPLSADDFLTLRLVSSVSPKISRKNQRLRQICEKMFHSFGPIFCMALNTGRIGRTKQTIVAAEFHLDSHKLWIFQLGSENSKRALRPGISFPDGRLWARVTLRTCLATVHFQVDRLLMGLFALFWWLIRSLFSCRNGTRAGLSLG